MDQNNSELDNYENRYMVLGLGESTGLPASLGPDEATVFPASDALFFQA
jgi:hypothetical protein